VFLFVSFCCRKVQETAAESSLAENDEKIKSILSISFRNGIENPYNKKYIVEESRRKRYNKCRMGHTVP